jgi:type IV pilus assembly protein PilY1
MRAIVKAIFATVLAVVLVGVTSTPAAAQGEVITNGTIALGVNPEGHLNVTNDPAVADVQNSSMTGVAFFTDYDGGGADWRDATSPGCFCEGFGVAVTDAALADHSGYANVSTDGGANNLTVTAAISATASTAVTTAEITTLPGLEIVHDYHPSASANLYEATVTITNNTGGDVTDVLYRRVMDWDIPPTEFSEFVTIQGVGLGDLANSGTNGFQTANPLITCGDYTEPENTNVVDSGVADHGACFTFDFGDLADGESKTFNIYYGAAPTEAAAFAALAAVGAEGIYSFGQNSQTDPRVGDPATFIFGFGGVGAPPIGGVIPEPATLLLVGTGLVGAARQRYRNRKKQQQA